MTPAQDDPDGHAFDVRPCDALFACVRPVGEPGAYPLRLLSGGAALSAGQYEEVASAAAGLMAV
eukprot:7155533-Prymnesium_polylepis.1